MLEDAFFAKQATKIMGCAANNQMLLEQEYEQLVRDTAPFGRLSTKSSSTRRNIAF